jgi:hypothetical protein
VGKGLPGERVDPLGVSMAPGELGVDQRDRCGQVGDPARRPADRRLVGLIGLVATGRQRRLGLVQQRLGLLHAAAEQRPHRLRHQQPRPRADQLGGQRRRRDVPPEPHRVVVASVQRQPGDRPPGAAGPVAEQAGLPKARRGAHQCQLLRRLPGEALQQPRTWKQAWPRLRHMELVASRTSGSAAEASAVLIIGGSKLGDSHLMPARQDQVADRPMVVRQLQQRHGLQLVLLTAPRTEAVLGR